MCQGCLDNLPFKRFQCTECKFVFHVHDEVKPRCVKCDGEVEELIGIIPNN